VSERESRELSPDDANEWLELVEQVLEGVHHALNNRIGSMSAVVELFQLGDLPADGSSFDTLSSELMRLADCNRVLRLLPRDGRAAEEALIVDDVLADVFAIHRFLHDVRELQVTIVPTRHAEPVRLQRWAVLRVLTLLLADAKRCAKRAGVSVRAATESDEQSVRVEFRIGAPPIDDVPLGAGADYAERLAGTFGGTVGRQPGIAELRMPTLKARRAAEGLSAPG
jgi:hypothetical protein